MPSAGQALGQKKEQESKESLERILSRVPDGYAAVKFNSPHYHGDFHWAILNESTHEYEAFHSLRSLDEYFDRLLFRRMEKDSILAAYHEKKREQEDLKY